jgi:hypothetical protein
LTASGRSGLSELEVTADHEAGHAVVARLHRRLVTSVSIEPGEATLGHALTGHPPRPPRLGDPQSRAERLIIREIMMGLAGSVAEHIVGHRDRGSVILEDYERSHEMAASISGSPEEAAAMCGWLYERTLSLLRQPLVWDSVERVKSELVQNRRVTGRRLRELVPLL